MRFLGRLFSVVCVLSVLSACSDKAESLPIVPYPQDVVIETGSFNALGAKVISEGLDDAEIALVDKFGQQTFPFCLSHLNGQGHNELPCQPAVLGFLVFLHGIPKCSPV